VDFDIRYTHRWDGDLRLAVRYLAGMEEDSRDAPYQLVELPGFTTVDIRIGQRFFRGRLETYFGVDNLFDASGEVNLGFPVPGRTFIGGGSIRF
jgi:outer membrane receptor protein involved in Fe transport